MTLSPLPVHAADPFRVFVERTLSPSEEQVLLELYQPLMGAVASALYLTLLSEGFPPKTESPQQHHWLLSLLSLSLQEFLQARHRLEALGLMRSYVVREGEGELTYYRMIPPLSPREFFQSDVLALLLYKTLGEKRYRELRARFVPPESLWPAQVQEVTKAFHEVYPPSLLKQVAQVEKELWLTPHREQEEPRPAANRTSFRIQVDRVRGMLGAVFRTEELESREGQMRLEQLASYFRLNETELVRLLRQHLMAHPRMDWEEFRLQCLDYYASRESASSNAQGAQSEARGTPPPDLPLEGRGEEEAKRLSAKEIHQQQLETVDPLTLLEAYHGGAKIPQSDVRLVKSLTEEYGLPTGVANVLIEYVMFTNQYRLPRSLVEKIAGHWKRLGVASVSQAQALCRQEHQVYRRWVGGRGRLPGSQDGSKGSLKRGLTSSRLPQSVQEQLKQEQEKAGQEESKDSQLKEQLQREKEERALQLLRALGEEV